jgi:hypothetical protein
MNDSPKNFLLAFAILTLSGASLPSSAVAGMIWSSLKVEADNAFADAGEMTSGKDADANPPSLPTPENGNFSEGASEAGCGAVDTSANGGASSPALLSEVQYPPLETSLSFPIVYLNPQVPAFHLDRIFRPPREIFYS